MDPVNAAIARWNLSSYSFVLKVCFILLTLCIVDIEWFFYIENLLSSVSISNRSVNEAAMMRYMNTLSTVIL